MSNLFVSVLCISGLWVAHVGSLPEISPEPLRIAAFNIRVLGVKKLRREEVKTNLAKVGNIFGALNRSTAVFSDIVTTTFGVFVLYVGYLPSVQ